MRAIFFDKDGTLVENIPYNKDPERVVLCRHAIEALQLLQQCGYALFIVSNQDGIAKGYFSEDYLHLMQGYLTSSLMQQGIVMSGFYYCPHHPDGIVKQYTMRCGCRKPMPGLLLRVTREHAIDLTHSWMIGDILNDVEAGRRAGCKTILIGNGNETEWDISPLRTPDFMTSDLLAAAQIIRNTGEGNNNAKEKYMAPRA